MYDKHARFLGKRELIFKIRNHRVYYYIIVVYLWRIPSAIENVTSSIMHFRCTDEWNNVFGRI